MPANSTLCYSNLGLSQITFSLCPLVYRNINISYKKALETNEMLTCIILYNLPFIWPVTKKNENEKLTKQNKYWEPNWGFTVMWNKLTVINHASLCLILKWYFQHQQGNSLIALSFKPTIPLPPLWHLTGVMSPLWGH